MKKGFFTILVLLMMFGLVWAGEPFYRDLNQAQRYDLSQAYLSVSEHYKEEGDAERAAQYRIMADQILTSIAEIPSNTVNETVTTVNTESEPIQGQERLEVKPVDERTQKAILYYFKKICSTLEIGNVEKTMENLSFPMTAGSYSLDADSIEQDLTILAENYDLSLFGSIIDWYNMDSAQFYRDGDGVVLSLETTISDPEIFIFWNDPQQFSFIQQGRAWRLQGLR